MNSITAYEQDYPLNDPYRDKEHQVTFNAQNSIILERLTLKNYNTLINSTNITLSGTAFHRYDEKDTN